MSVLMKHIGEKDDHFDLISFLDGRIKGQSDAKSKAAIALKMHIMNCLEDDYSKRKINTLIVGPTGSGKTEIAESLASYIGIPFIQIDCARLSSAGFKGSSIDEAIRTATSGIDDVAEIQRGVLFLDEIDKLCLSMGDNASNEKIQFELLRVIEGTTVNTDAGPVNTKNMMVIAAGSFTFAKDDEEHKAVRTIGISSPDKSEVVKSGYQRDFLIKNGLKKELMGRLHNLVELTQISANDMFEIIKTRELKSLLDQMSFLSLKIDFSDDELMQISEDVIKMELGARGARSILYSRILDKMHSSPSSTDLVDPTAEDNLLFEKFKLHGVPNIRKTYKKGRVIIREGQRLDSIFLIASGQVAIFFKGAIHNYLSQGTCIGGHSAFFGQPSVSSIKAAEDVVVYEFNAEDIKSNLTYSAFTEMMLQISCSRKDMNDNIKTASRKSAKRAA